MWCGQICLVSLAGGWVNKTLLYETEFRQIRRDSVIQEVIPSDETGFRQMRRDSVRQDGNPSDETRFRQTRQNSVR